MVQEVMLATHTHTHTHTQTESSQTERQMPLRRHVPIVGIDSNKITKAMVQLLANKASRHRRSCWLLVVINLTILELHTILFCSLTFPVQVFSMGALLQPTEVPMLR